MVSATSGHQNKALCSLPDNLGTSLRELVLDKCKSLEIIPASIGNLRNLKRLVLREAKALRSLPDSLANCHELVELNLLKCIRFEGLPDGVGQLPALEDLFLAKCKTMTSLWKSGADINLALPRLATLDLKHCKNLQRLPANLTAACPRLHVVWATDCAKLTQLPTSLTAQLDMWDFTGCPAVITLPEHMPTQQHRATKKRLRREALDDESNKDHDTSVEAETSTNPRKLVMAG